MKNKLVSFIFAVVLFLISVPAQAQVDSGIGRKFINERIIVKFKGGDLETLNENEIFKSHKVKKHKFIKENNSYVVLAPSKNDTLQIIEKFKQRSDVEYAEPDYYCEPVGKVQQTLPNDPQLGSQWWINNINLPGAWALNQGSSNVIIAIIDTGCDATHEDLKDKYVSGYNFFDNNTNTTDVYGHGTATAGCAAASTNNAIGIASAGYNCKIMPLRVSDTTGYAYWSTIATALQWAADHGAKVANASYAVADSSTVQSAARYFNSKGGVFTCSAGNSATVSTTPNVTEIIVCGATDSANNLAGFSNSGSNMDVVAPGVNCLTTANGNGYRYASGTSFSSPITAGVCGLILSANPALTPNQVDSLLKNTALDLGSPGQDSTFGYGLIDAQKAIENALKILPPPPPPADTTPPSVSITSPTNGASLSRGNITVNANASDNVGVTKVDLYIDGKYVASDTTAPYSLVWNAKRATVGSHTIRMKAFDAAGNSANSAVVTITIR